MKNKKEMAEKYFPFMEKLFGYKGKVAHHNIELTKPWYSVLRYVWKPYLSTVIVETIAWSFLASAPLLISQIFEEGSRISVLGFTLLFFLMWLIGIVNLYFYARASSGLVTSFFKSAYKHFALVDPQYHATRSTGEIISKIGKCRTNIEAFSDIFVFSVLPVFIQIGVITVSFSIVKPAFGLQVLLILATILGVDFVMQYLANKIALKPDIKYEDKMNSVGVETLQAIYHVRGSFATDNQLHKITKASKKYSEVLATGWMVFINAHTPSRVLFVISMTWLLNSLQSMNASGDISTSLAIGLGVTYFASFTTVVNAGRNMEKLVISIGKVKDLFDYAKKFGRQTFPVTGGSQRIERTNNIDISIDDLVHAYGQTTVFNKHILKLSVPISQSNKLYGIIGPSGTGKTTLVNILGGLLKPKRGIASINDYDIYKINDSIRRQLIAVQLQTSTSLRGTLRMNLVFGISQSVGDSHLFEDKNLISILTKVGLWDQIFKDKDGLETFIGEGGITLSGGQLQRLNFASLYLRAKYYKPQVLLIDEPTSSLDGLSEIPITNMIEELAQDSLTLVVAHRLQTLDKASAIMDTSLLNNNKEMKFYSTTQLEKVSTYYRKLTSGEINLDE